MHNFPNRINIYVFVNGDIKSWYLVSILYDYTNITVAFKALDNKAD